MLKAIIMFLSLWFFSLQVSFAVEIELITIGAGQNYWEAYGHSALRVKAKNQDLMYGFGYFNFNDDDFFVNFAKGEMQYFLGVEYTDLELDDYSSQNRNIWSQQLNLTSEQKLKLIEKLNYLSKEENRYYQYDYFLNNCTSQIRDLLDEVTGGEISKQLKGIVTKKSWNDVTFPSANQTWMNLGIAIAYGLPAYEPRNKWQLSIFPVDFAHDIESLKTDGYWNSPLKIMNQTESNMFEYSLFQTHYAVFLCVLLLFIGLTFSTTRVVTTNSWLITQSILGVGLLLLWFATKHTVAINNINVLLFFPLSFMMMFHQFRKKMFFNMFVIINIVWLILAITFTNLYLIGFCIINIIIYTSLITSKRI